MQVIWDVVTRTVVVIFRGEVTMPPERFTSRWEAIAAGEQVCRNLGWETDDEAEPTAPLRRLST